MAYSGDPITVACVYVQANVPYSSDYVVRLKSMVERRLSRPHRFVCFTNCAQLLPKDIEVILIRHGREVDGWWAKLNLFDFNNGLRGPGLYLDLDTLVVGSLDPIADFRSSLALIPHAGTFEGKYGKSVVKQYNSSVMRFQFGAHPKLFTECTPMVRSRLWGDQDWIGEQMPYQPMFPISWFPRLSEINHPPQWPKEAKVILCKRPKNHIAAERYPWFKDWWR